MVPALQARRLYLIFALTLIGVMDVGLFVKEWPLGFGADFSVFWGAVRHDPYRGGLTPFAYPPTTLLWLQPLRLLPLQVAYAIWNGLSAIAFFLAARRLWPTDDVCFAFVAPMVLYGLIGGQFSLIVAALIFLAYSTSYRGVLLGVALTIKPQLLFLAPIFLLIERDYRAILEVALTGLAISAAATVTFGWHIWFEWIQSIPKLQHALAVRDIERTALSPATLYHLPAIATLGGGILLAIFLAVRVRDENPQVKSTVMAAASLLAAPYSLRYELTIFAPAMAAYIVRGNWKSLLACIPFCGIVGTGSLAVVLLQLADRMSLSTERNHKV